MIKKEHTEEIKGLPEESEKILITAGVQKVNSKNVKTECKMMLTTSSIIIQKKEDAKRISLEAIDALILSSAEKNEELVLHFSSEPDFRFLSEMRDDIIRIIRKSYEEKSGKCLPLYTVPNPSLADFVTTKEDLKNKISKIPEEKFLCKEEIKETPDRKRDPNEEIPDFSKMKPEWLYQRADSLKFEELRVVQFIGNGCRGKTYLIQHLVTSKFYAMKKLDIEKEKLFPKFLDVLKEVHHPFFIDIEAIFKEGEQYYFLMNYMPDSIVSLLEKEKKLSVEQCKFYIASVVMALHSMHSQGVVHRDMKIEKIFIREDGYIGLLGSSFTSIFEPGKKSFEFLGTPEYLAPEIISQEGHDRSVDWWMLGICLYTMLFGNYPFTHTDTKILAKIISSEDVKFPESLPADMDKAKDLIIKLLAKNPKERIGSGLEDGGEILKHPFFEAVNLKELLEKKIKPTYIPSCEKASSSKKEDSKEEEAKAK